MDIFGYLSVVGVSTFKIMVAVAIGAGVQMGAVEIFLCSFLGGMAGIAFYSFWGVKIKRYFHRRRIKRSGDEAIKFNIKRARKFYRIYHKFGLIGIAALTPPILTPPIGAILAVSFGEDFKRTMVYMSVSMALWCGLFAFFADGIVAWMHPS